MKNTAAAGLAAARRLYRKRRFSRVITLLESQVFLYRDSYSYYYLLGMSCLYNGDFAGAQSYLNRALDLDFTAEVQLGLAAVHLRRQELKPALRTYLSVLDTDPHNRYAERALNSLRTVEDPQDVETWFHGGRIRRFLPALPRHIPRVVIVAGVTALIATVGLIWHRPIVTAVESLSSRVGPPAREGGEELTTPLEDQQLVEEIESARYMLTPDELERQLQRMRRDFNAHRDNLVRRELNRVELSNASELVKERARQLAPHLKEPDFASFDTNFPLQEVRQDPPLHHGTYVKWRGRIANLTVRDEVITFDLLVGYQERKVVEGIVAVTLDFAVLLTNDDPVEVIGLLFSSDPNGALSLEVTAIRRLNPNEHGP